MANSVAGLTGGGGGWIYVVIMSGSITLLLLSLDTQRLYSKDLTLATENQQNHLMFKVVVVAF